MTVQVISKRKFQLDEIKESIPVLAELRFNAKKQPGFISREILRSLDNPEDYLVICQWETVDDWKKWLQSEKRKDLQYKLDHVIGEKTHYETFEYVRY